jgi:hypothetical protein
MNKIISIGYTGIKQCYLNVDEETAIARYCKSEGYTLEEFNEDFDIDVDIIEFDDEFGAYSIWEK